MLLPNLRLVNIHPIHKPPPLPIPIGSNQDIIPTHHPLTHLPRLAVESPVLQPVAALPAQPIVRVLELVPELHGDPVVREREQLLPQTIPPLALPLRGQELDDALGSGEEGGAVAPDTGRGVGLRDSDGVSGALFKYCAGKK